MFALLTYVVYAVLWILLVFIASFISWKLFKSKVVTTIAGLIAFGVMYWPAFGDLIPTLLAHKEYCEKEAGFKVYVTPEQWMTENPGVIEALVPYEKFIVLNDRVMSNERIGSENHLSEIPGVAVRKSIVSIIDIHTNKLLAQKINFVRGYGAYGVGADNRAIKIWLYKSSCFSKEEADSLLKEMKNFYQKLKMVN